MTPRQELRLGAACFLALGAAVLALELLSGDPGHARRIPGALQLMAFSAAFLFHARS